MIESKPRERGLPRVLIFEPHASGHRAIYVKYLLESMSRLGGIHASWVVNHVDRHHPQVVALEVQFQMILQIISVEIPAARENFLSYVHPQLEKQFRYMRIIDGLITTGETAPYAFVLIPFIDDYCLAPLAAFRAPFAGLPWGGIIIRPRFHFGMTGHAPRRPIDYLERGLYARLFRAGTTLREVFTIDPFFCKFVDDPRLRYIPDPAEMDSSRYARNEGDSDDVVLVYGQLDRRKGIPELLRALDDPRVPQHIKLWLVGVQDDYVRSLLKQPIPCRLRNEGRLVELDRVVTDDEEAAAFRASAVVWNFYPGNYGPSGVLVRAGQASKPVICTMEGYCGRIVTETGMGLAVRDGDADGLVNAFVRLFSDENVRNSMGTAGREYFSKSTPSGFADPIVQAIIERICPGSRAVRSVTAQR